jgi:hypothetical protein
MTIHAHMPEAEYRAHPAWSWSTAKHALACPAEALDQRERPIDSNDAMRLGTMIHTAILEPAEYALRYIVPPVVERQPGWDVDGKRGAYTVRGVEYATKAEAEAAALPWGWAGCTDTYRTQAEAKSALGAAMPGEWVTQELYDDVAARAAQAIAKLPAGLSHEVAMLGSIEGCAVKGRADGCGAGVVLDVKTSRDLSPAAISRTAAQSKWPAQVWTYGELARQAGYGTPERYCILVVQAPVVSGSPLGLSSSRQPRHHARLLTIDDAAMAQGRRDALMVWRAVRDCAASGVWPDYPDGALSLPRWALDGAVEEVESW